MAPHRSPAAKSSVPRRLPRCTRSFCRWRARRTVPRRHVLAPALRTRGLRAIAVTVLSGSDTRTRRRGLSRPRSALAPKRQPQPRRRRGGKPVSGPPAAATRAPEGARMLPFLTSTLVGLLLLAGVLAHQG